jgi:hypothetical protein
MIESAIAHNLTVPRDDAGYKSWQSAARKALMRHDLNDRTAGPIPAFGTMVHETALAAQGMQYAPADHSSSLTPENGKPDLAYAKEDEGFSFGDIIDIINPLQHLPVIGTLYRKFTGDMIKPFSNIIGGAIFGGPIGAVSSTVNVVVKNSTGKDIAENAFSAVGIDTTPLNRGKPDIVIEGPASMAGLATPEKSLAVASLYAQTALGQKNFAARAESYSWNT